MDARQFVILPYYILSILFPVEFGTERDIWHYGPEYVFAVDVNMTVLKNQHLTSNVSVNYVTTTLTCRPGTIRMVPETTLSCRFGDENVTMWKNNERLNNQFISNWRPNKPFEIHFAEKEIKYLVVSSCMDQWKLNMMRSIVSQLNHAMIALRTDKTYKQNEKSYIGKCDTSVNKTYSETKAISRKGNYEFASALFGDKTLEITKERHLDRCVDKKDYVFLAKEHMETQIVSSRSRVVMSKRDFESSTENVVTLEKEVTIYEKISLRFDSAHPATQELLPAISHAVTTGLHVYDEA